MSENYLSTTGTPKLAGVCPRCGGQAYQGLTHQCSTSVTPTQQVIVVGNSKMTEALKAALKGKESIPVASPQATRSRMTANEAIDLLNARIPLKDKKIIFETAREDAAQPAAGTTPKEEWPTELRFCMEGYSIRTTRTELTDTSVVYQCHAYEKAKFCTFRVSLDPRDMTFENVRQMLRWHIDQSH